LRLLPVWVVHVGFDGGRAGAFGTGAESDGVHGDSPMHAALPA
jgi:hypothetical protein